MDYVLGFVLLLGVLVFIHEFGHFIVAKAFGMRVETFSIGMGKKILTFRRGETEYAISLVPLGGYVKITGQDPREEVEPAIAHRSFTNKPLYQRAAVVLAGPLFNAALAVIVLSVLYGVGVPSPAPVLERVLDGSVASKAGFKTGDKIARITYPNGDSRVLRELTDLEKIVGDATGETLTFSVIRNNGTEQRAFDMPFAPVQGSERDSTIGVIQKRGTIPGVERRAPAPVVVVAPASWAADRHLPPTFWISSVNGQSVENYFDLERIWSGVRAQSAGRAGEMVVKGRRVITEGLGEDTKKEAVEPAEESFELAWKGNESLPASLHAAGLNSSELVVIEVKAGSPAEKLGLRVGDLVSTLNGAAIQSFQAFKDKLQEYAGAGQAVSISWIRAGKEMRGEIHAQVVSAQDPLTEVKRDQFQIGAAFLALPAMPTMVTVKADGPLQALQLGTVKTVDLTVSMLASFYHLAAGDISPKTLGGPILIGKIAGESFRQGYVAFLRMMAFISLNLFILNLLPIPVLDGGHLILYCIEAIRRRPLSARVVELWTTTGFFLLMGLVAVVFFNDLSRLGLFKFFRS